MYLQWRWSIDDPQIGQGRPGGVSASPIPTQTPTSYITVLVSGTAFSTVGCGYNGRLRLVDTRNVESS
jgi:hypothetical protein